jgi:hypothetical protein
VPLPRFVGEIEAEPALYVMDFPGLCFLGWGTQSLQPTRFFHEPTLARGKWGCIGHQAHLSYVEFLRESYNTLHKNRAGKGAHCA